LSRKVDECKPLPMGSLAKAEVLPPIAAAVRAWQGLTLIHVRAQLEQLQDTFRVKLGDTADRRAQVELKLERVQAPGAWRLTGATTSANIDLAGYWDRFTFSDHVVQGRAIVPGAGWLCLLAHELGRAVQVDPIKTRAESVCGISV